MTLILEVTNGRKTILKTVGDSYAELEALIAQAKLELMGQSTSSYPTEEAFFARVTIGDTWDAGDFVKAGPFDQTKVELPESERGWIHVPRDSRFSKLDAAEGTVPPRMLQRMPPNGFLCNPTDFLGVARYATPETAARAMGFVCDYGLTDGSMRLPSPSYGRQGAKAIWKTGTGDASGTTTITVDEEFSEGIFGVSVMFLVAPVTTRALTWSVSDITRFGFKLYLRDIVGTAGPAAYTGSFKYMAWGF